jgi:hypothetical protein
VVFLVCFEDLALGDLVGDVCVNPSWFLAGFLGFLLIWQVLVDINLAMDTPCGVPTIPKVLHKSVE